MPNVAECLQCISARFTNNIVTLSHQTQALWPKSRMSLLNPSYSECICVQNIRKMQCTQNNPNIERAMMDISKPSTNDILVT